MVSLTQVSNKTYHYLFIYFHLTYNFLDPNISSSTRGQYCYLVSCVLDNYLAIYHLFLDNEKNIVPAFSLVCSLYVGYGQQFTSAL